MRCYAAQREDERCGVVRDATTTREFWLLAHYSEADALDANEPLTRENTYYMRTILIMFNSTSSGFRAYTRRMLAERLLNPITDVLAPPRVHAQRTGAWASDEAYMRTTTKPCDGSAIRVKNPMLQQAEDYYANATYNAIVSARLPPETRPNSYERVRHNIVRVLAQMQTEMHDTTHRANTLADAEAKATATATVTPE
jgi:hypothetical protein